MPEPLVMTARLAATPTQRRRYHERETLGTFIYCRGDYYQLCFWLSAKVICPAIYVRYSGESPALHGFSIGCGFFTSARDARIARTELTRLLASTPNAVPLDVWRCTQQLQQRGIIPIGRRGPILPLWVKRSGKRFVGVYHKGRDDEYRTTARATAEAAHNSVWNHLVSSS